MEVNDYVIQYPIDAVHTVKFAELLGKPETAVVKMVKVNRPGFPGECFICEFRLPDHRFRWK
ncbi:hypothetical protein OSK67_15795, partial [Escherichia coli]|nr:hypothetical protein [Escherichia coli]